MRNYIRDSSGIFSVFSLMKISSLSLKLYLNSLVYDRNIFGSSSKVFGNFLKSSEIFENVREHSSDIRLTFGTILENLRKSSENRPKCRHQYVYIIKRALHGSSKIPILCSRGKNNILYRAISAFKHCM